LERESNGHKKQATWPNEVAELGPWIRYVEIEIETEKRRDRKQTLVLSL
jgi:hypothetical protein